MSVRHVVMETHRDGVELDRPVWWCGSLGSSLAWRFMDAQHVLIALRDTTSIAPCKRCLKAMRRLIDNELD